MTLKSGKGEKARETAFAVSDKTEVIIDSLPGKLAELKAGQVARITHANEVATRIQADNNLLKGEVVKVEDGKLTVHVGGQKGEDVAVPTADKVTVLINNAPAKLADVKAGQLARVSRADNKATWIEANDKPVAAPNKAGKGGK